MGAIKCKTGYQKQLIDAYYTCFSNVDAYMLVNGIKKRPKRGEGAYMSYANTTRWAKQNNPKYVQYVESKMEKKYSKMRDKLVSQLEDVSVTYFKLMNLAMADELTEEDKAKFNRLKQIITTRDLNQSVDTIAKLTGSYESQKVEVSNTFKVSFGGAAKLEETTKDVIDVTEKKDEDSDDF
ncbi:hypothetical protein [Zunongwangia atlantica]|uniref:Uncharacterized protein n=1 Tax=Zunongwangia atlantica 22II14-10F7 TaxID=1185767 RepID=A0A1Y1T2Y6_9FLAO|nr:hypothetical protein [Zunongwangia atlantica]ORL45390.1 hypothetical protein IIF7_11228 [Zunongwangia atlantica 22II14-10F7]